MENTDYKKQLARVGIVLGYALIILSLVYSYVEWKSYGKANGQFATITVSGEGEVVAKPDVATVTFTVRQSAKTVPEAQKLVEDTVKAGLLSLKDLKISDSDVKTLSYTVSPKYETQSPCFAYPCPQTQSKVVGYEVSESVSVKIRAIEKAGSVLGLLGSANITEMSGPDFTIDDSKKLEEEAKGKAIAEAREKAEITAKQLGVSLGDISGYSENNGGYYPVAYAMKADAMSSRGGVEQVSLPQGETNIKSNVTITYIIK